MVIQGPSGMDKISCLIIGLLQRLTHSTQAIILVPTKEVAIHMFSIICSIGAYTPYSFHICISLIIS